MAAIMRLPLPPAKLLPRTWSASERPSAFRRRRLLRVLGVDPRHVGDLGTGEEGTCRGGFECDARLRQRTSCCYSLRIAFWCPLEFAPSKPRATQTVTASQTAAARFPSLHNVSGSDTCGMIFEGEPSKGRSASTGIIVNWTASVRHDGASGR